MEHSMASFVFLWNHDSSQWSHARPCGVAEKYMTRQTSKWITLAFLFVIIIIKEAAWLTATLRSLENGATRIGIYRIRLCGCIGQFTPIEPRSHVWTPALITKDAAVIRSRNLSEMIGLSLGNISAHFIFKQNSGFYGNWLGCSGDNPFLSYKIHLTVNWLRLETWKSYNLSKVTVHALLW